MDREVRALVATIERRWDERFLCILGGEDLHQGEDHIVTLTEAHEVPAAATALQQVMEAFMRHADDGLDPTDYGPNWSEEDFEYTWSWFLEVRDLWSRAATAGRAVIFTVS